MVESFVIAIATLLIALYLQARRAAREIRERGEKHPRLIRILAPRERS